MKRILILGGAMVALAGCSTVVEGTSQRISVNTTPPGAACEFTRHGESLGKIDPTPGSLKIDKTKYDIMIECSKEGYQKASYVNHSDVAGATVGNIILGGGIGWAIDSASGSDNKYEPTVNINLAQNGASAAVEPAKQPPSKIVDKAAALTN
ncbi:hypothetical protein [Parvibaculum sp.]|uniref:hypothetical protein n=1 Tax=Parvibaculum sp. TaxID=2024848 RepID=UPI00320EF147